MRIKLATILAVSVLGLLLFSHIGTCFTAEANAEEPGRQRVFRCWRASDGKKHHRKPEHHAGF